MAAGSIASPMSVSTQPGQTALTRMFMVAQSKAALLVKPITPCLVA